MTDHPFGTGFDASSLHELEQLNSSLDGLLGRYQQLTTGRTAGSITGTDDSGVATAELSPSGDLVRLEVERDWKARVAADALGPACSAAVTAALGTRLAELQTEPAPDVPAPDASPVESSPDPRPLEEISDQTDRIMTEALAFTPTAPTEVAPPAGVVSVRLIGNQVLVHIDPDWARSASGSALNAELAAALESATPEPGPDLAPLQAMQRQLDGLFAEAMTHLRRLT